MTTLALVVARCVKVEQPDPWQRWISKLVSLLELSVQAKFIWLQEAGVAERLEGAVGVMIADPYSSAPISQAKPPGRVAPSISVMKGKLASAERFTPLSMAFVSPAAK